MTQKQEKRICSHFPRSRRNGRLDTAIVGFAHQQVGGSEHPKQASLGGRGGGVRRNPGARARVPPGSATGLRGFGCITTSVATLCLVPLVPFTPILRFHEAPQQHPLDSPWIGLLANQAINLSIHLVHL